jgi:hypothetical protein
MLTSSQTTSEHPGSWLLALPRMHWHLPTLLEEREIVQQADDVVETWDRQTGSFYSSLVLKMVP